MCALSPSRYNFAVCGKSGGVALFNASTGSTVRLDGPHAQLLAESLLDPKTTFSGEEFAPDLASQLRRGSFLVQAQSDEVQTIRTILACARCNASYSDHNYDDGLQSRLL